MTNREIRRIRHQNASKRRETLHTDWTFGASLKYAMNEQRCTEILKEMIEEQSRK